MYMFRTQGKPGIKYLIHRLIEGELVDRSICDLSDLSALRNEDMIFIQSGNCKRLPICL